MLQRLVEIMRKPVHLVIRDDLGLVEEHVLDLDNTKDAYYLGIIMSWYKAILPGDWIREKGFQHLGNL